MTETMAFAIAMVAAAEAEAAAANATAELARFATMSKDMLIITRAAIANRYENSTSL